MATTPNKFKDVMLGVITNKQYTFCLGDWQDTFTEFSEWHDFAHLRNAAGEGLIIRWTNEKKLECEIMSATPALLGQIEPFIPNRPPAC